MENYENKIEKALQYLKQPDRTNARGNAPIVYLVYSPEDVILFRNLIDSYLMPKAEFYGFKVKTVSIGNLLEDYINSHRYHDLWGDPETEEIELYRSINQEIVNDEYIEKTFLELQDELKSEQASLLLVRDVELLHPFNMMGVIENKIYNNISVPTLVLYPGETQGTARSFLGIYNQDGNYRSVNY